MRIPFFSKKKTTIIQSSHRYLVTMPYGIGDTIHIGLAVVDQIIRDDPKAYGAIDVVCNLFQSELLSKDPRITPIAVERELFPTQHKSSWYKIFYTSHKKARVLANYLSKQHYRAIFPGNGAFHFIYSIKSPVMYPSFSSAWQDFLQLRKFHNAQAARQSRRIVNRFFGKTEEPNIGEPVILYIDTITIQTAKNFLDSIQKTTNTTKTILVAPDTTSQVTRPPTDLLANVLTAILAKNIETSVILIPSYDSDATENLAMKLKLYENRIHVIPFYPRPNLLFLAGLTDCVNVVLTGDTGIMHIAAAKKRLVTPQKKRTSAKARNIINTIALFGGTNPGLYAHPTQTIILGRGNSVQRRIRPGLLKEGYNPKERTYFTHLTTAPIIKAVNRLLKQK